MDGVGFWVLRIATYLVLLCTLYIFWDITKKGAPVLFGDEDTFINMSFLTEMPETLVVFEDGDGEEVHMDSSDFRAFEAENPEIDVQLTVCSSTKPSNRRFGCS